MKAEKSRIVLLVTNLLAWLKDVLPAVTAVGSIIYNYLLRKINKLEKEKEALELQVKIAEQKEAIDAQVKNMSDSDVIRAAIDGRDTKD